MIEFQPYVHHGRDLEKAVLGACLLEKSAFGRTYGLIDKDSFYDTGHQEVYSAMKKMYDKNLPIDILTVTEFIITKTEKKDINGTNVPYFIIELTNWVVSTAHLEYHCHLIKEMWRRRRVLELKFSPLKDDLDPRVNVHSINAELNKILDTEFKQDWYDMSELMYNLMMHQKEMAEGKKAFITTGFKKVDEMNGGFYNGQMIVIGARPSVGKSALMGRMAIQMARAGKSVGIVSLEMNNTEIAARLASIETDISFYRIFNTIAQDEDLHKRFYNHISKKTINLPIYLSDKTKVNVNEIRAKATKLKATRGCDCLFIDYLQLVDTSTGNKNYNREQEVGNLSRGIKLLAFELNIPVIILCQLNREVTKRSYEHRLPKLSDLRESGSIEQDADIVMFLHRDYISGFTQTQDGTSTEKTADLVCAKWRNGQPFHLPLDFEPEKMKFSEIRSTGFVPVKIDNLYETDKEENPF